MTLCRKCGKEIPDGEELCQDCQSQEGNLSDAYLDELMKSMETEPDGPNHDEPVATETVFDELPDLEEELLFSETTDLGEDLAFGEETSVTEDGAAGEEPEEDEPVMMDEPALEEESVAIDEPLVMEEPALAEESAAIGEQEEDEPLFMEEPALAEEPVAIGEPEEDEPLFDTGAVDSAEEEEPLSLDEPEQKESEEETVDDLIAMLSQDFENYEAQEKEAAEASNEEPEAPVLDESPIEASLFSEENEDGGIFADDVDSLSIDNIFNDALSVVDYSEAEQEEEALDEFVSPEEAKAEPEAPKEEVLDSLMVDSLALEDDEPAESKEAKAAKVPKEKKDSIWKRVFGNIITEQSAEEEERERQEEQASAEQKAAAKEEKKKQAIEEKAKKAEQAQAAKEKKAAEKAEQAAVKAAEKEEKKRLKAEAEANEVVGKINPLGASIVMVCFGLLCVATIIGSQVLSHSGSVKGAENSFEKRDYKEAYRSLAGINISEDSEDFEMKDKIRICMQLQHQLDSYANYYEVKMYLEALDSLMKGIRSYDENQSKAERYNIVSQYNELEVKLAQQLYEEFGVSESQARSINSLEDQIAYTSRLENIIAQWEARNKEDEK